MHSWDEEMVKKDKVSDLAKLRKTILETVQLVQSADSDEKSVVRELHSPAVQLHIEQSQNWIRKAWPKYGGYFANGSEIQPTRIRPILVEVLESWQADLFRLARLTWSLPYTKGYGRRLRFLLVDDSNGKLIGILGLQSPPLDFPARDRLFRYPEGRKVELVNQTMDIYTLGAVPPYNRLLGGKLVALAALSDEVRQAYRRRYAGRLTTMHQQPLPARLVALTTTSAFGRSSLYNRLKYNGEPVAWTIGHTEGYGSFHLATLYPILRKFLEENGVSTRGGFGVGPRIVWQNCVRALERLGLSSDLLKHGIKREVYLFQLARNLVEYMEGRASRPIYYHRSFDDLAAWWRERWLLPRSERVDGWRKWERSEIEQWLLRS